MQSNLLQRKCGCGQSASLTGQCNECQRKKLAPERGSTDLVNASEAPPVVHEVLRSSFPKIQPKLKVSQPNDKYEQEADRIAEQVMQMPEPSRTANDLARGGQSPSIRGLQSFGTRDCPKEKAQLKPLSEITPSVEADIQDLRQSSGQHLPSDIRTFMEPRFGYDFSQVRIHKGSQAAELAREVNAKAFTVGHNIVFADGQHTLNTSTGRKLLAHELVHVCQQNASLKPTLQRKIDKISTSGCTITINMNIGIYGSRATPSLAQKWQQWINSQWSKEVRCSNSENRCPVIMAAAVKSYSTAEKWWQVPETNRVFVEVPGYRSQAFARWGSWAEDEDKVSVAHETGHLMGLIDRYWYVGALKSMSRFENDIMGDYYRDPGPTEFHRALARVLARRGKVCPCCKQAGLSGEERKSLQDLLENKEMLESPDLPQPLEPRVPNLLEIT